MTPSAASVSIVDKKASVALATTLTQSNDTNLLQWNATQTVGFSRASSSDEGSVYGATTGYELWRVSSNGAVQTFLLQHTLAELGGSAGQAVATPFAVAGNMFVSGDKYVVYSYNDDGRAVAGSTGVSIADRATPVAVALNPTSSIDTNLVYGTVTITVSFTRDSAGNENPSSAATIVGYKLYLYDSQTSTFGPYVSTLLLSPTESSPGGVASVNATSTAVSSYDRLAVVAYNADNDEGIPALATFPDQVSIHELKHANWRS